MDAKEFVKIASTDSALCERLAACTAPEEAYEIAKATGVTDSFEDFCHTMEEIAQQMHDLSEENLEALNAGITTGEVSAATWSAAGSTAVVATMCVAIFHTI